MEKKYFLWGAGGAAALAVLAAASWYTWGYMHPEVPHTGVPEFDRILQTTVDNRGRSMEQAPVDEFISRDKAGVYFASDPDSLAPQVKMYFATADAETLAPIGQPYLVFQTETGKTYTIKYYRDRARVYLFQHYATSTEETAEFDAIEDADPATFAPVDALNASDAAHTYRAEWREGEHGFKYVVTAQ